MTHILTTDYHRAGRVFPAGPLDLSDPADRVAAKVAKIAKANGHLTEELAEEAQDPEAEGSKEEDAEAEPKRGRGKRRA